MEVEKLEEGATSIIESIQRIIMCVMSVVITSRLSMI